MEIVYLLFLAFGFLGWLTDSKVRKHRQRKSVSNAGLLKIAENLGGVAEKILGNDWRIDFPLWDIPSSLKGSEIGVEMRAILPSESTFQATIVGGQQSLERPDKGDSINTGDESFDHDFRVTGTDPDLVRSFLDDEVRDYLKAVVSKCGLVMLEVDRNSLRFFCGEQLRGARILQFADFGKGIVRAYLGTVDPAMAFLQVETRDFSFNNAACPICGSEMHQKTNLVFCTLCDTPHHNECWSYFGGCAMFGCGGRKTEAA